MKNISPNLMEEVATHIIGGLDLHTAHQKTDAKLKKYPKQGEKVMSKPDNLSKQSKSDKVSDSNSKPT